MKKTLSALCLIALLPAGAAFADSDDCAVPRGQWQSRDAALKAAQDNGWTVAKIKVDDGCYEVKGQDSTGRAIKAKLDPATLRIVKLKYRDDRDGSAQRAPAPAGPIAPPPNGLFGNGAPP